MESLEGDSLGEDTIIDKIKGIYYIFEDKWYDALDVINEKIPVNSIIDPIDEIVPSFMLFSAGILILLLLLLMLIFSLFFTPSLAQFQVFDENGNPLGNIPVSITADGQLKELMTNPLGKVEIELSNPEVEIKIDAEGYKPFHETVAVLIGEINEIELKIEEKVILERTMEFYDKDLKDLIKQKITAVFSCSSGVTSPGKKTTYDGTMRTIFPEGCKTLSAVISSDDYETKTISLQANRTRIDLSRKVILKGKIIVSVREKGTDDYVSGIKLKVYDSTNNLAYEGLTDGSGKRVFEVVPDTYTIRTYDSTGKYNSAESGGIEVGSGEQANVDLEIETPADGYKLKLKFVDSDTNSSISGVRISLYDGNLLFTVTESASDGTMEFVNLGESARYSVVAQHQSYITKVLQGIPAVDSLSSEVRVIPLESIDTNQFGTVTVEVRTLEGTAVDEADVRIYDERYSFHLGFGKTGDNGYKSFFNLPPADYYAKAQSDGAEGISNTGPLNAGETLPLPIVLVLKEGSVEVTVVDAGTGQPIEGSQVGFYNSLNQNKIAGGTSDAEGKIEESFKWNIEPYVVVEKAGYFRTTTPYIELSPGTKKRINVELVVDDSNSAEPTYPELSIKLARILKENGRTATSISKQSYYFFEFRVVVPSDSLTDIEGIVRAGADEEMTSQDSSIVIKDVDLPYQSISAVFSNCFDSSDNYSICSSTINDAKQLNINFGDLGKGVYFFRVKTFVKDVEDNALLEMWYGVKGMESGTEIFKPGRADLYRWFNYLGEPIYCDPQDEGCPNFAFVLMLSDQDSLVKHFDGTISLEPGVTQQLLQGVDYTFQYQIYNWDKDKEDFRDIALDFIFDPINLSVDPPSQTISVFEEGTSIGGSVSLSAIQESALTEVTVALNTGKHDNNVVIPFEVLARKNFEMEFAPSELIGDISNNLVVTVKDAESQESLEGVMVTIDEDAGFSSPYIPAKVTSAGGSVNYLVDRMAVGDFLYVKAEKEFYQSQVAALPVVSSPLIHFDPLGVECVTVEDLDDDPELDLEILHNFSDTFRIRTDDCDDEVDFYLFVPSPVTPITLEAEGHILDQSVTAQPNIQLQRTDFVDVKVNADQFLGQYGVYIKAKYRSRVEYSDLNRVDVYVMPLETQDGYCFEIDKTSYNIFHQEDSGTITNRCHFYIPNPFMPSLNLESQKAGVRRPYLDSQGIVNFNWTAHAEVTSIDKQTEQDFSLSVADSGTEFNVPQDGVLIFEDLVDPYTAIYIDKAETAGLDRFVLNFGVEATDLDIPGNQATRLLMIWDRDGVVLFEEHLQENSSQGTVPDVSVNVRKGDVIHFIIANDASVLRFKYVEMGSTQSFADGPHTSSIIPSEDMRGEIVGTLSDAIVQAIDSADRTNNVISLYVGNDNGDVVNTWITYPDIYASFLGDDVDDGGLIDATIYNQSLEGEEYALLTVEDYTSYDEFGEFAKNKFNYTIWGGTDSISYSGMIPSDGELHAMDGKGADLQFASQVSTFYVTDDSPVVSTFFEDTNATSTSNPQAHVMAKTAAESGGFASIDMVFVIDKSGSMNDEWSTICGRIEGIKSSLLDNGLDTKSLIYEMGEASEASPRKPCADAIASWSDPSYAWDSSSDEAAETWAPSTEFAIDDATDRGFWRPSSYRMLIIISDNIPSGNKGRDSGWRGANVEEKLVMNAIDKARSNGVTLFVLNTSLEVDSKDRYGDPAKYDAIELMEMATDQTGGFIQTYSESDLDLSLENQIITIILRRVPPKIAETFHVRLASGEENVCYGRNDLVGYTGPNAAPRLRFSWDWHSLALNESGFGPCDYANQDYVYCDGLQFTKEIVEKLIKVEELAIDGEYEYIDGYLNFESLLIADGYNDDFFNDFYSYVMQYEFTDAPMRFTNGTNGWQLYFQEPRNKIHLNSVSEGMPVPLTGLYKINISLGFEEGEEWVFFENGQPNADININFERISELRTDNILYYIPFDGEIGTTGSSSIERDGYGVGYSGDVITLFAHTGTTPGVQTFPGQGMHSVSVEKVEDLQRINSESRGVTWRVEKTGANDYSMEFAPSYATPILTRVIEDSGSASSLYYVLKDSEAQDMGDYGNLWTGVASNIADCRTFDGSAMPYKSQDFKSSQLTGACSLVPDVSSERAYGFGWSQAPGGGRIYLRTIFYTPTDFYYLVNGCINAGGIFISPTSVVIQNQQIPLNYDGKLSGGKISSVSDLLGYVGEGKMCISPQEDSVEIWWNPKYLYGKLEENYTNYFESLQATEDIQICETEATIR
ncbi:MAG: carboxypeptidase-like regulatory domain-containing protein [Candidatus Diapherotrites archaeon]